MNVSIIRRIEALEQRSRQKTQPPSLIIIHYQEAEGKWVVSELFTGPGKAAHKTITKKTDRLQDYFFKGNFEGRVILDTFGNPEADIYENLFVFDIDDLRKDFTPGECNEIAIHAISDQGGNEVTVTACKRTG